MKFFATCARGLEPVLGDELRGLDARDIVPGRDVYCACCRAGRHDQPAAGGQTQTARRRMMRTIVAASSARSQVVTGSPRHVLR